MRNYYCHKQLPDTFQLKCCSGPQNTPFPKAAQRLADRQGAAGPWASQAPRWLASGAAEPSLPSVSEAARPRLWVNLLARGLPVLCRGEMSFFLRSRRSHGDDPS